MKEIRVLLLNGSPRANGNTALALREMEKAFAQNGVQTETVLLGNQAIRGCTACGACAKLGRCVFDDAVNARIAELGEVVCYPENVVEASYGDEEVVDDAADADAEADTLVVEG